MLLRTKKVYGSLYICAMLAFAPLITDLNTSAMSGPPSQMASMASYKQPSFSFQPNLGQTDPSVRFLANTPAGTLFFTPGEVVITLSEVKGAGEDAVRMRFVGANPNTQLSQGNMLPGRINYFLGNDPSQWRTNVPTFGRITYKGIYASIDLNYSGADGNLKGTYVVASGADPTQIRWRYEGATSATLDGAGDLQVALPSIALTEHAPLAWQEISGKRIVVSARYSLDPNGNVGFTLGQYDPAYALTLDPTITYSTYLGGSSRVVVAQFVSDSASGIAVDAEGNVYVTGTAGSVNFPTKNPLQSTNKDTHNAFVAKINAAGNGLIYSTYLGGTGGDFGAAIAVDADGNAYITGATYSQNFPLASNPFQATNHGDSDAFVVKLDPTGSTLLYSTYLGGGVGDVGSFDGGNAIAVDNLGYAIVTGNTWSLDFPTHNPYQAHSRGGGDIFVTRLDKMGRSLVYSTYLGGSGYDAGSSIAVDSEGKAYLTGSTASIDFPSFNPPQQTFGGGQSDAFITEFKAAGNALVYSTYLGGSGKDQGLCIAVGRAGNAFVTGSTESGNFPTSFEVRPGLPDLRRGPGGTNAFVTEVRNGGSALLRSIYLGGNDTDTGKAIALDPLDNVYIAGSTKSADFPSINPVQPAGAGLDFDAFVTKLGAGLVPAYSTVLGGHGTDGATGIAVDDVGNAYVVGNTDSTDYPLVSALQSTVSTMFVTKLNEPLPPPPTTTGGGGTGQTPVVPTVSPVATPMPTMAPPVSLPGSGSRFFPQTGKTVKGIFLQYWDTHGGLAQQGYPISDLFGEISDLDGKPYTVQYFERAVFEYHPENAPPFNVLLSQLGTFRYKAKYPNGAPNQIQHKTNGQFFPQTGHWVGGRFLQYWNEHGGLAQQGYPLSDEFTEISDVDGKPYTVQYFERAVFEMHLENQPPYDVLLSLLGVLRYLEKYGGH